MYSAENVRVGKFVLRNVNLVIDKFLDSNLKHITPMIRVICFCSNVYNWIF